MLKFRKFTSIILLLVNIFLIYLVIDLTIDGIQDSADKISSKGLNLSTFGFAAGNFLGFLFISVIIIIFFGLSIKLWNFDESNRPRYITKFQKLIKWIFTVQFILLCIIMIFSIGTGVYDLIVGKDLKLFNYITANLVGIVVLVLFKWLNRKIFV